MESQERRGARYVHDLTAVGAILLFYRLIDKVVMRGFALPEESYTQPVISAELLAHHWPWPVTTWREAAWLIAWVVALGFLVIRRRSMFDGWTQFAHGSALRPVVVVLSFVAAWRLSTYDYNLFFDQAHYVDRVLLLALVPLISWRPIFAALLVPLGVAVLGQFQHPMHGFLPSHEIHVLRMLTILPAALVARAVGLRIDTRHVVFVGMLFVATAYWASGVGKLALGWLSQGHVYNMFFATYSSGWATFLTPEQVSAFGRTLDLLDPLLMAGPVIIEVGVLVLFWSRRSAVGLLCFGALFHVAVFMLSGILFWMWIVVDLTLAIWLVSRAGRAAYPDFSRPVFVASLFLIPLSLFWFRPIGLSWLDVPLSYTYRFEAVAESGHRYALPPHFFAPNHYEFTVGSFDSFVEASILPVRWGAVSDPALARALLEVRTPEEIVSLERERGRIGYRKEPAANRDRFLERWVTNYWLRGHKRTLLTPIRAPRQLVVFPIADTYAGEEPICEVVVHLTRSFFDGQRYMEIPFSEAPIHRVVIDRGEVCRDRTEVE